tara:strand:- start:106 stop:1059 length:954 start_codon:yes stop_codon:yes gene_type:complete
MNSILKRIIKKIFNVRRNKKNILLREIAKESDSLTLLDIGSAGDIEPRWLPIAEKLNYIGVEPDERSSCLLSNLHNCKNYKIINSVIWSEKTELSFNLCRKPQVSSVFRPNNEFLDRFPESKRFEIVNTTSFESSTLDIELGNIQVDFVKLDIQGGELFALKGMQNNLHSCLGLEIEVEFSSLYKKQPLFGEVYNYLNDFGFEFIDFTNLCRWERNAHNSYGQCVFGDGLWMRSPEDVANNFPNKCLEYLLICSLYGRYDLVSKIIEIIKPKLSKNYKTTLDILMTNQKKTRKTNLLFNYLIKFITGESTIRTHLIY